MSFDLPRWIAFGLALTFGAGAALGEEPPTGKIAATALTPGELLQQAAQRVGGEAAKRPIRSRATSGAERWRAAQRWFDEMFAPTADPQCRAVLEAAGLPLASPALPADKQFPGDRPLASAPAADEVLVPQETPILDASGVERLRTLGLMPFELGLSGECARVVGASHSGPAPKDSLLRVSRAARLEGLARLVGMALALRAAGVDPGDLGAAALSSDRDDAGVPRDALDPVRLDPLRRALWRTFFEDGLRWALFHYMKGGLDGVVAALERPAAGPESLLRPGASRARPALGPGCGFGPRGAAALLTGDDEAEWIASVVGDRWSSPAPGQVAVTLVFEDEPSATRAQEELRRRGLPIERTRETLTGVLRRPSAPARP